MKLKHKKLIGVILWIIFVLGVAFVIFNNLFPFFLNGNFIKVTG